MAGTYVKIGFGGSGSGTNITQINNLGSVATNRPQIKSMTTSTVTYYGANSTIDSSVFMNDGNIYTISSDVSWDITADLDTGSEAISTTYFLYAIPSGNAFTVLGSTSSPETGPSGETVWAYLGSVRNNASGNLIEVEQSGSEFLYKANTQTFANNDSNTEPDLLVLVNDAAAAPTTLTAFSIAKAVPSTAKIGHFRWSCDFDSNDDGIINLSFDGTNVYTTLFDVQMPTANVEFRRFSNFFKCPIETTNLYWGTVSTPSSDFLSAPIDFYIVCLGYIDKYL